MKNRVRRLTAGAILAALALRLAQAGGMADMPGMSGGGSGGDRYGMPGRASAVTRTVRITTLDTMRFTPSRIDVGPGQTVRFVIHNAGRVIHEFVIGDTAEQRAHEAEMAAHPDMTMDHDPNGVTVPAGQTRTLLWRFPRRAATLEYACHEPGHFAAGMVGYIHLRALAPQAAR
ncbi:MAG TPA: plastocyanin/azurin family copper-binding protein [Steroidobacteraceae bacterium]|nr:plastocyanin/azurin family copper-binding protein [Steroidobacteraceae bacterium]